MYNSSVTLCLQLPEIDRVQYFAYFTPTHSPNKSRFDWRYCGVLVYGYDLEICSLMGGLKKSGIIVILGTTLKYPKKQVLTGGLFVVR